MNRQPSMLWPSPTSTSPSKGVLSGARQIFTERKLVYPLYDGKSFTGRWVFTPREWLKLDAFSRAAQFQRFAAFLPSGMTPAQAATLATQYAQLHPTSNAGVIYVRRNGVSLARAGQAGGIDLPTGWQWDTDASGNPIPVGPDGTPVPLPSGAVRWVNLRGDNPDQGGTPVAVDADGNPVTSSGGGGLTSQQETALLTTAGQLLGTIGTDIVSVLHSQDQVQIAALEAATRQHIADLQSQAATPQNTQNLATLQLLQNYLGQQQSQGGGLNTNTLIIVGIGAIVLLAGVWMVTQAGGRSRTRRNPVVRHRGRRKFLSMAHVRRLRGLR